LNKYALGLDGKTLVDQAEATRQGLQLFQIFKKMGVQVDGLGSNDDTPVDVYIPVKGLSLLMGSIASKACADSDCVQYTFARGTDQGLHMRTREYKKSPRDGSVHILPEDVKFTCS
jgi:hypothetical protein